MAASIAFDDAKQQRTAEVTFAVAVVAIIALMILPLPPLLLDLLIALSIGSSLVVLLAVLQTTEPLEFSTFPPLLLLMTLFRLGLNVASMRLILGEAHAGSIIQAFGERLIAGNYAVGIALFLTLVAINFIVITKGAGRVAEVAARFNLDAMPGKQMAIDADLQAGLIDETEARTRREKITREADFYGACDGASKFIKGDAIAAVIIMFINILGGIFIGVLQKGFPLQQAASTYTILTVGEGLVAQIPAVIISTAAGLMVTRSSSKTKMGNVMAKQVGGSPLALYVAAGVLGTFAVLPGLPMLPFLTLAGGFAYMGRRVATQQTAAAVAAVEHDRQVAAAQPEAPTNPMTDLLQVDPIELEIGYAAIPLVDEAQGGDLLERIKMLRKQAALELGLLIPQIRIRDDIRLQANDYVIKIRGALVARGEVMPRFLLALNTGNVGQPIEGIETRDPSFGMPACWIPTTRRAEAEAAGYVVVEATTMLATHLMETLKLHGADLLGRQDVQEMVDTLKRTHPALVEELVPGKVTLSLLHRVLQRLLKERIPIRDLVTILEALGDGVEATKDPELLVEHVRRALANTIGRLFADHGGQVRAITLGPRLETALMDLFSPRATNARQLLSQAALTQLLRELTQLTATHAFDGRPVPIVTTPQLRVGVRRLLEPILPTVPVLSLAELPAQLGLASLATWDLA